MLVIVLVMLDRIAELPRSCLGKIISSRQLFIIPSNYSKSTIDADSGLHIYRAYKCGLYIATTHFVIVTYLFNTSFYYLLSVWK